LIKIAYVEIRIFAYFFS